MKPLRAQLHESTDLYRSQTGSDDSTNKIAGNTGNSGRGKGAQTGVLTGGVLEDDLTQLTTWCHGKGAEILLSSHIQVLTMVPHGDKKPHSELMFFLPQGFTGIIKLLN